MPRSCSICSSVDVTAINAALLAGEPLRTVGKRWSVSKTALLRHKGAHLPTDVPSPAGLLKLQSNYLRGSQAESEKGKLIERVIRRVGRDAAGEAVHSEETFSAREQIEIILTLDKFLFGEVKAITEATGESAAEEDTWITSRLKQIAAGQGTELPEWVGKSLRQIAPNPGLIINVVKDD